MKLRTIIVDDERMARVRLMRMLGEAAEDVEIVEECATGADAVEAVRQHCPDLLFLDVQMSGMDGFDVLAALGSIRLPVIVFVTAYDFHAIRAFEACALDYLLKPASPERLAKTLVRAREYVALARAAAVNLQEPAPTQEEDCELCPPPVKRFCVRSGFRTCFISPEEIDWIEADGNYAILHLGRQQHLLRETMSALEAQLPRDSFLRVSRSAILHLRRVKELQASADGHRYALVGDSHRVPVTRSIRELEQHLAKI